MTDEFAWMIIRVHSLEPPSRDPRKRALWGEHCGGVSTPLGDIEFKYVSRQWRARLPDGTVLVRRSNLRLCQLVEARVRELMAAASAARAK